MESNAANKLNFSIPTRYLAEVEKQLERMDKKCQSMGIAPLVVEKSAAYVRSVKYLATSNPTVRIPSFPVEDSALRQVLIEAIDISVTYFDIVIPGDWKVVASITRSEIEGLPIINGKISDISELMNCDINYCDHCGITRRRNKVIVLDDKDGNRKVVGSTCIKDYLGIDAEGVLLSCELSKYISLVFSDYSVRDDIDLDECPRFGYVDDGAIAVNQLAYLVSAVVRNDKWGYTKRNHDDYQDTRCTTYKVNSLYGVLCNPNPSQWDKDYVSATLNAHAIDLATSQRFIEEAKAEFTIEKLKTGTLSSFDQSFGILVNSTMVPEKSINLFIGMFGYRIAKAMHIEANKSSGKRQYDKTKSEFAYNIGDKVKNVEIEVLMTRSCSNDFGTTLMISGVFAGTDNQFVTFTTADVSYIKKDKVFVDFSVKDHQDRGYGKQTVLLRMKEHKEKAPKVKKPRAKKEPVAA